MPQGPLSIWCYKNVAFYYHPVYDSIFCSLVDDIGEEEDSRSANSDDSSGDEEEDGCREQRGPDWGIAPVTTDGCSASQAACLVRTRDSHEFDCFSTLNSRRPLKRMMTPVCPWLWNMINDCVLLRF